VADTINVPGAGPVKKPLVIGGIAILAGILAVAYYRHAKNKAAAPAADTTQDPNAIDPATGLTYGEEAAGIQAGDLAGAGSAYGDTSGLVGYDAQGNPVYADTVGYGPAPSFVSNGAWSQAAQQYLVASTGADAGTVAAALGTYLAGQPLTSAQASVVQQAIAFFGQPPQAGSNGYPPSLNLSGASGSSGGSTGSGGSGDSGTGAAGAGAISNLQPSAVTRTSFTVRWNPAHGATHGYAYNVTQLNGKSVKKGTTKTTSVSVTGLHPGFTYNFGVQALPGGPGDNIHVALPSK
jgi:hypothetical protein